MHIVTLFTLSGRSILIILCPNAVANAKGNTVNVALNNRVGSKSTEIAVYSQKLKRYEIDSIVAMDN